MNLGKCVHLDRRNVVGTWYRAVDTRYLSTAINSLHTKTRFTRFAPGSLATPSFEILYFSENHDVILREVEALVGLSGGKVIANPELPALVAIPVQVYLSGIVDLTEPGQASLVEVSAQELTGDFREYSARRAPPAGVPAPHSGKAPTQKLGEELFNRGFTGLISFSAKMPAYKNLIVFPQRLVKGDSMRYTYTDGHGRAQTIIVP